MSEEFKLVKIENDNIYIENKNIEILIDKRIQCINIDITYKKSNIKRHYFYDEVKNRAPKKYRQIIDGFLVLSELIKEQ